jgi:hypothetical protein
MIFQLFTQFRHHSTQFQVLWYGGPEWNSMLVYCFCYVQNRAVEPYLVQNSSIRSECLATIFLSPELNKKTFTENFNFWLCGITIYHIFLFLFSRNLLNILVKLAKFISHPQVRNPARISEFNPW